ncbi:GNAT family N-acetyltransferase [Gracilibacillus oryzae]|uniref:GNAT family N-acetyltransferase n=1 Tax=Gracilibacillus oryzae TaxID=1672701 RepID=A0A7C8GVD1_9BACI|nr:GNAT family N-acetyltransferase [Gracilibacillus oryzae]KAB8138117.1 GNAT family N-acetyltransferase [Gracilibacillus oryzae]
MLQKLYLIKPTIEYKTAYLSFYQEWKDSGETMVPWVIGKDPSHFEKMLESLYQSERGENLPENWVPDSTYWLVNEDKEVLGVVNIRHRLTYQLFQSGGHIGYGIRPSERRKGYATTLLSLALEKTKELGLGKVLVVCVETNIGSKKTILKNGGIQDDDFMTDDANVVNRFWITTSN